MKKEFNITGLCFPAEHYMADVSRKLARTYDLVELGKYFIIHRPRQYGKTTLLHSLADMLRKTGEYIVFNTSFEGIGDVIFTDEKIFAPGFVRLLARYSTAYAPFLTGWLESKVSGTKNLEDVSAVITEMAAQTDKKIVLIIDEVDKSSNNQLFVSFLAMLRSKYLDRYSFKTFHSVVLAGLHDVKSLKLKLRPEEEQKYNSPWNIAAEFKVDMNLQPAEIKPMLEEYAKDRIVDLNAAEMADSLFYFTSGYPFLVSKLCKMMDEELLPEKAELSLTIDDLEKAVAMAVKETNTNFDSLIKTLEQYPELYQLVSNILMEGEEPQYSVHDPVVSLGLLHGILKNGRGISVHNKIYESIIYDYMTSKAQSKILLAGYNVIKHFRTPDRRLNMELVLLKFQTFMREQYSGKDRDFLERNGRLMFLAFLKPIINGAGYEFKEVQISEERRLDVVVTFYRHKYIAELKIWRGEEAHREGLDQLADYLDRMALHEGYLLIFDHANKKTWNSGWTEVRGKKVFVAWV